MPADSGAGRVLAEGTTTSGEATLIGWGEIGYRGLFTIYGHLFVEL